MHSSRSRARPASCRSPVAWRAGTDARRDPGRARGALATAVPLLAAGAAALLAVAAPAARAGTWSDARSAAMGGSLALHAGGDAANPAWSAVPAPGAPRVIPLPLGLARLAAAPPVLDPADPAFSVLEVFNLAVAPPVDLQLAGPPNGAGAEVEVAVREDALVIDLGGAQAVVPPGSRRWASRAAATLWSARLPRMTLSMTPLVVTRGALALSDALERALRAGAPLAGGERYTLDGEVEITAAAALGVQFAQELWPGAASATGGRAAPAGGGRRWRLYGGTRASYLVGLGYVQSVADLELLPGETLLDAAEPLGIELGNTVRTALPGVTGGPGQGYALDLGLVAAHGQRDRIGFALQNAVSSLHWRTRVERQALDPVSGAIETVTLAPGAPYRSTLPRTGELSLERRWSDRLTTSGLLRLGAAGPAWHLGGERRLGGLALRAGAAFARHERPQWSGGGGWRCGRLGLDLALYTASASLAGDRALMLGSSFTLYPGAPADGR